MDTDNVRNEGSTPRSLVNQACNAGVEAITDFIEERGEKVLATYAFVLVEGVTPNGGQAFSAHEDDGPEDPAEMLSVLLGAVSAFAQANDLPMGIMEMPAEPGGQG